PPAAPVAAAPTATAPPATTGIDVKAPSIGVFWQAPEPGAAPFVAVGQRVEAGQEMCIIEVMKLMNRVQAPVTGVVQAVHVANGEAVEFATPLFTIAPE
ncbi:MAG: acetyl-CoA carboxylase biotin carboxyl carrier protein subunit, partial [Frankiales bacterium]|nr:acetyl-CoA carboxylase biotin carboxyl carrier protein subunit [Frankiales bacterium]